jgi:hypothetical protein
MMPMPPLRAIAIAISASVTCTRAGANNHTRNHKQESAHAWGHVRRVRGEVRRTVSMLEDTSGLLRVMLRLNLVFTLTAFRERTGERYGPQSPK